MKLYAAFGETDGIWPTTIRRTMPEAIEATRQERNIYPDDPFTDGVCLGEFDYGGEVIGGLDFAGCIDKPFPPKVESITWLYGYRANKRKDGP